MNPHRRAVQMLDLWQRRPPSGYVHVSIDAHVSKYVEELRATIEKRGGKLINSGRAGPVGSVDLEMYTFQLTSGRRLELEIDNWGMGDLQGPAQEVESIDSEMRTRCGLSINGRKVGAPLRFR